MEIKQRKEDPMHGVYRAMGSSEEHWSLFSLMTYEYNGA